MFSFFNLKRPSDFGRERSSNGESAASSRRSSVQPGPGRASADLETQPLERESQPGPGHQHEGLTSQGPPSAPALSPVPHLLGAALAAVRSQPSEEFRRSGDQGAAGGAQQEFTRSWAESQQPRSFSVLQSPVQSEAVGDYNSRYVDQQQQQQQSDYYNSSGALSPSIFDQCQPYSSEEASEGLYLHAPAMATQGRPPSRPPPPNMRPPVPGMRPAAFGQPGPPPAMAPPPVPASPAGSRKLSLQTPPPNSGNRYGRPPETIGENKIIKFGETKLRSPSPGRNPGFMRNGPERKTSAPPHVNASPIPFSMNNGVSVDMQNFLGLLEHEESDFVDQVKKSKTFIQKIIKDKEDLGVMVANHTGKIKKLELERMDYQKRIIEAEREKRHFDDRLENERQSTMAALQRLENQKQEYDKLHQESSQIARERNDAVASLNREMRNLEKLERERREMAGRIDELSNEQASRKNSVDMNKSVGDLNMKLKMEIGALRGENEGLVKRNEETSREIRALEEQIQQASRSLNLKDGEVKDSQFRIVSLQEDVNRLKKLVETSQEEARRQASHESEAKIENAQLKSEFVAASDKIQQLQRDIQRVESEKRDGVGRIEAMQAEMRQLRMTLEDFESNKSQEANSLQTSLTKSLLANRELSEKFEREKKLVADMENTKCSLQEQIEKLQIDAKKQHMDAKNYLETIKNKKKVEEELLQTIQEIKEKVEKYEGEKKSMIQAEKMRKSSVATQEKEHKKEWEERIEKLKTQFDKAAVESKKNINKLTEENTKYSTEIEEIRTDLEKKAVETRTLTTKLASMEKEFTRYKTWSKSESDKYEKHIEEIEQKLGEQRRSADSWKRKHDSVQTDLESVIKEKYKLQEKMESLSDDIVSLKESHSGAATQQEAEKAKVEQRLREANGRIRELESEVKELKRQSEKEVEDLNTRITNLKNDVKKAVLEKESMVKKVERIANEKDSSLASEIESRDNQLRDKESEINDLKEEHERREYNLKCDIKKESEERTKIVNQMSSEIDNLKADISTKQNQMTKLEKEKREVSISLDKNQKKLNEVESDKTKLKDSMTKLEGEKKQNNFGKYEKEKLKLELENVTKDKQTLTGRIDEITREKNSLNEKLKELGKLEGVKNELCSQKDELSETIKDLNKKCKDLEANNKKDKESFKTKEKTLADQVKSVSSEKDKLEEKIAELQEEIRRQERELKSVGNDLKNSKKTLEEKEKLCKSLQKEDNAKSLSDRISMLEKQKSELDKKSFDLENEKSTLSEKVAALEADKKSLSGKIQELQSVKDDMTKKVKTAVDKVRSSGDSNDDLKKLQKENQTLQSEKNDLSKSLKQIEKDLRKSLKDVKPNKVQGDLKKLAEKIEKNSLVSSSQTNGTENGHAASGELRANFDSLQKDFEARTAEIERLTSQLTRSKTDCNTAVEKLRVCESELGQIKEKNAQLSDELLNKSRIIAGKENGSNSEAKELQRLVEDLRKKLAEAQGGKPKKSLRFAAEPEVLNDPNKPSTMKELEEALQSAYAERNEIIVTCRKEVDFHRTIAAELEQSIMEDFEWKLHEMEKDYNSKLKYSKEKIDEQIKEACRGILREKDDEINKLQIKLRKDMDEKLKKEREELQAALQSVKIGNSEAALSVLKNQKDADQMKKEKKFEEKKKKYHREIDELKKQLSQKDEQLKKSAETAKSNSDNTEEKGRIEKKFQEDREKLRKEMTEQMEKMRTEYDGKIVDYEARLEKALADKVEKMLVLREEVEQEYADRMDELRDMYKEEMSNQVEMAEKDKERMQGLENSLQDSLKIKRQEFDEIKVKYDEAATKVTDLERRLNNQTEEVLRLTAELESYEYE